MSESQAGRADLATGRTEGPSEAAQTRPVEATDRCYVRRRAEYPNHLWSIEPGCPWENGYAESLIGKLREKLLNREILYTLTEAEVLVERWRQHYNTERPHSSLGCRPPAPEAVEPTHSLTRIAV